MWPGVDWTLAETILLFLAAFGLAQYVALVVYGVLGLHGGLAGTTDGVLAEVAGPVVIFGWLRIVGRPAPAWFGRAGQRAGDVGIGIAVGFGLVFSSGICILITVAIANLFLGHEPDLPKVQGGFNGGWLIAFGLLLSVVAPLCEELLFRGLLFRGLRTRWGWWPAALLSSLLFAVAHGNPYRFLNTFVDGLVLAAIYERRKSLITTIAAHATLNTIILVALLNRLY